MLLTIYFWLKVVSLWYILLAKAHQIWALLGGYFYGKRTNSNDQISKKAFQAETNNNIISRNFSCIIIGSFIYQLIDAFKESDTEKIEKKLDKVITMLEQKNNSILGGEQNAGNQSNPTEPKRTHSDKPRKRNKH
jgi:hypothetical protein